MINKTNFDNDIKEANKKLFHRYLNIIEENKINNINNINKEYLHNFCLTAIKEDMQEDKHSRWLGFLQGVLFS